eukprot:10162126-Ditylum_brightwellii.AAC.2
MSLSMLRGNFKLQDMEWGKLYEWPAIPFIPKEESTEELDKVDITLWVSPNATGSDAKSNVTKVGLLSLSWRTQRSLLIGGSG